MYYDPRFDVSISDSAIPCLTLDRVTVRLTEDMIPEEVLLCYWAQYE